MGEDEFKLAVVLLCCHLQIQCLKGILKDLESIGSSVRWISFVITPKISHHGQQIATLTTRSCFASKSESMQQSQPELPEAVPAMGHDA